MRTSLRRSLAATAAAALLVALTACGGDDASEASDDSAAATSESASESAEATPDAEASADAEESEEAEGEESVDGEEVDPQQFLADFQEGVENSTTAHMTMTTGFGGMTLDAEGDVDYTTAPPSMAMTMTNPSGAGQMEVRFVDGVFYMNLGQASQDKFVKLDPDDPNSPMGDMSQLTESMDPLQAFEQFAQGLTQVVYVGEEEIDGDDTDHYVLTLDTTKVEVLEGMGTSGLPQELDYDVWLDDDNRLRQVKIDLGTSGMVEMAVSDWDKPVDIEAPPANQITAMPGQ